MDIEVPATLVGEPPAVLDFEGEALAWRPFAVELPQECPRPEYGSRLWVVWARQSACFLLVFFPWYLDTDRVISMDKAPIPDGDTLVFQSRLHGPGRVRPITPEDVPNAPPGRWYEFARKACDLAAPD